MMLKPFLSRCVKRLPRRFLVRMGQGLGLAVYSLDRRHRRIVRRNLQFTHPDWTPARVRMHAIRVFQHASITLMEILQIACWQKEDILANVRIKGRENLAAAQDRHRGIILFSAHLGNWEIAPLVFASLFRKPTLLIARPLSPRRLNTLVVRLRSRFGASVVYARGAARQMVRTLKNGGAVGLLVDQNTTRAEGVEVTFFGKLTYATPGVALLARRYDAAVLPVFCTREEDFSLTLRIEPPLPLVRSGRLKQDLQDNTQAITRTIEAAVNASPDQWFWFHKRWKKHYPELYPEDIARRQRQRNARRKH